MDAQVGLEHQLRSHVSRVMGEIEDAEAALFATREGLPLAFEVRFNPGVVDRLAALAAMLFAVSNKASDLAQMGDMDYMEVSLKMGKLFLYRVNEDVFLVILTSPETNVGLVRLIAKDVAEKARKLLG